ncbi:DUF4202 domain-containing protein [Paracoccus jeotgali]|uniref:DUF4202 domain-containing protein n=1 Tax=Paracoccus jeotgali TaxID=2065379 RepID=UPI0028B03618|nr:DUF4202 domain-containing protein [Paracoccus jeotgali]
MNSRLTDVFARIDAANAADPNLTDGQPVELLYGQRMTAEQRALYPEAGEALQIACRGQHIERWRLPRSEFPEGRKGYLDWRREQARRHAERVGGFMREAGYDDDQIETAGRMIRKEGIKRDDGVQALQDVACFTFMRHYMAPFAQTQSPKDMDRIVNLTARKMSAMARDRALQEFDIPEPLASHFRDPAPEVTG